MWKRTVGVFAALVFGWATVAFAGDPAPEAHTPRHIGVVEAARFHPLVNGEMAPVGLRLTHIARQEARSVEAGEIDLSEYEGAAILVQGVIDGGWIYEAEIVDRGSPILTELIKQLSER